MSHRVWVFLTSICFFISGVCFAGEIYSGNNVKVTGDKGHWTLTVNERPFYIKGVGVGHALSKDRKTDFLKLAREMGANTVRTWGYSQGTKEYMDKAQSYGLLVDAGFWLNPVYPGVKGSYINDRTYINEVRRKVLSYVKENRNHPAVLAWNIGNETINRTKDEKERIGFCKFFEKLIRDVHRIDPYHPVIYTSAYLTDAEYIFKYVPSLDILGINVYGAVKQIHTQLMPHQKIPIVFTEFGPPGPWDLPKDKYQRPIELNDQEKADFYEKESKTIFENKGYNLGGIAFYLGETSQISLTWWNVNDGSNEKLSYIKLRNLYSGISGTIEYPFIKSLSLSKVDGISPGEEIKITADVAGEKNTLTYAYAASTARDAELVESPNPIIPLHWSSQENEAVLKAPLEPGVYRIYAKISDQGRNYTSTLSRTIHVAVKDGDVTRMSKTLNLDF